MLKKLKWNILVVTCFCGLGCNSDTAFTPAQPSTSNLSSKSNKANERNPPVNNIDNRNMPANEKLIWSGSSGGIQLSWTVSDFYAQSSGGLETLFSPLAKKGFREFAEAQEDDVPGEKPLVMKCDYYNYFKVLSVVGTLVSFEDQKSYQCERSKGETETRFTTVDLTKSGEVSYPSDNQTTSDKLVKLTDYFDEQSILHALLADPVIKKALTTLKIQTPPQSLAELPELFADNDYELGNSKFELRPDFLTRFAFHHVEGDKLAVRIGLPPHYGFNHAEHLQIGILLPVPESLQGALVLADKRQDGFLMKDALQVSKGQATKFSYKTDENSKE